MWNQFTNVISNVMARMNLTLCVIYYNWIFLIVAPHQIAGISDSGPGQVKITTVKIANNAELWNKLNVK